MNLKSLLGAAAVVLVTSSPSSAAPINLNFEFDSVSGTFFGLDDAVEGVQAATGFSFSGRLDTYSASATDLDFNRLENSFIFSSGALTDVHFIVEYSMGLKGEFSNSSLFHQLHIDWNSSDPVYAEAIVADMRNPFEKRRFRTFDAIAFTTTPISAVPLPAGGWLLLTGFAGVAALKRRKKRTV